VYTGRQAAQGLRQQRGTASQSAATAGRGRCRTRRLFPRTPESRKSMRGLQA